MTLSFPEIMKLLCLMLSVVAMASGVVAQEPTAPEAKTSAPSRPALTLKVRVHLMQSATNPAMNTSLTEEDIKRVFTKVNKVWSVAGIQFEIESIGATKALELGNDQTFLLEFDRVGAMIPKERLSPTAINVCYVKSVTPNGFYNGRLIVVKDTAKLKEVPGGIDEPLPRVTSHELGHALGLPHRQDSTNLMQSGTTGFSLNDAEITTAREKAQLRLTDAGSPKSAAP